MIAREAFNHCSLIIFLLKKLGEDGSQGSLHETLAPVGRMQIEREVTILALLVHDGLDGYETYDSPCNLQNVVLDRA